VSNKINQRAVGLLNLLESQSLGVMPGELLTDVRATVSLDDFYKGLKTSFSRISPEANTFGVDGILAATVVPLGEAWYLRQVGCTFRTDGIGNASGVVVSALNFRNTGSAVECPITQLEFPLSRAIIATPGQCQTYWLPQPLLLMGGEAIRWTAINSVIGAAGDFLYRPTWWYTKLSV
jgi:hypothetical protein